MSTWQKRLGRLGFIACFAIGAFVFAFAVVMFVEGFTNHPEWLPYAFIDVVIAALFFGLPFYTRFVYRSQKG